MKTFYCVTTTFDDLGESHGGNYQRKASRNKTAKLQHLNKQKRYLQ